MRRRQGTSLIEVLFAAALIGTALVAAYASQTDAFGAVARVDRRAQAESISLNVHERYFHDDPRALMTRFGAGGADQALRADKILTASMPATWEELDRAGFAVRVLSASLQRRAGDRAVHLTTQVSYNGSNGKRHVVTHSRVVASGLTLEDAESETAEGARTAAEPPTEAPMLPLGALASDDRLLAARRAMAGEGAAARLVFRGPTSVLDKMRATALTAEPRSRAERGSAPDAAAPRAATGTPLPPVDDEAALRKQWDPLEKSRVPPGRYSVSGQRFDQPVGNRTIHFEILRLRPLAGPEPAEPLRVLARHTSAPAGIEDDRIEGEPVLERRTVRLRAAGPSLSPAPAGLTAVVERTAERLYVTRPAFMADGAPAAFGRELAVLAYPEREETAGAHADAAWKQIAAEWCLEDGAAAASAADDGSDPDFDRPAAAPLAHTDALDVTLAQAGSVTAHPADVVPEERAVRGPR